VNDAVGEISFGDLARIDADDYAAEDSDSGDESSEYDTYSSSEDTESSDGRETEENLAEVRHQGQQSPRSPRTQDSIARAKTIVVAGTKVDPQPSGIRKSLSMKSLRSMASLSNVRRSRDAAPVPPLPLSLNALVSPTPVAQASDNGNRPAEQCTSPPVSNLTHSKSPSSPRTRESARPKEKKKRELLRSPELEYIPKLLPVFVEMMRGLLQPR